MFYNQSGRSFLRKKVQMRRDFLTTCTQKSTQGAKLQADATFSGRNERPQNRTDAKPCLSDVYKMSTRAKRRQTDVRLSGRSMVEMLGVLAIIGVLSVGAVSGYSKAMLKYKLNKQTEQLNYLLIGIIQYRHEWRNIIGAVNLKNYFLTLNLIPEYMNKDNTNYLYDVFDNRITINTNGLQDNGTMSSAGVSYIIDTSESFEVCQNIYQTAKSFTDDLFRIVIAKSTEEVPDTTYSNSFYGVKYCTGTRKCLADTSISDIYNVCQFCKESQSCHIWFSVRMDD